MIESRLKLFLNNRKVRVLGWEGQTDVGVHANGVVCTVDFGVVEEQIKRLSCNRKAVVGNETKISTQ